MNRPQRHGLGQNFLMHSSQGPGNRAAKAWVTSEAIPYLPDDIIINILNRLPADDIVRCRCVCRGWRDLTTTQEFVDMYLRRQIATAPVLVKIPCDERKDSCLIENWWDPAETRQKRLVFAKVTTCEILFSQGGLILLDHCVRPQQFVILNPINGESVTIKFLADLVHRCDVYGVFFHPLLKEYCTLWGSYEQSLFYEPKLVKFKLLVMGSTPYVKDIGNPLGEQPRAPLMGRILVNDHLYWMCKPEVNKSHYDIIEFDIKREEFVLIPSPVPMTSLTPFERLSLLNTDGLVSVVETFSQKDLLTIWTLKDCPPKSWTTSIYSIPTLGYPGRPIAFVKGDICFCSHSTTYVYNLKSETERSIHYDGFLDIAIIIPHVITLGSLRKCSSQIVVSVTKEETSGGRTHIIWEPLQSLSSKNLMRRIAHNVIYNFCSAYEYCHMVLKYIGFSCLQP